MLRHCLALLLSSLVVSFVFAEDFTVERYAGSVGGRGTYDGTGARAQFQTMRFVAADSQGTLYVASGSTVRTVTTDGTVRTLAGKEMWLGSVIDGRGAAAAFGQPEGIAVSSDGTIYVGDYATSSIMRITKSGMVTFFYRGPTSWVPRGLAVDAAGNVWVAGEDHTISKITPLGIRAVVAGQANVAGMVNANGAAARFHSPMGIAFNADGDLLIADSENNVVRKLTMGGDVTTLAIVGRANDIAVDPSGNAYVTTASQNRVVKVTSAGVVTPFAGDGVSGTDDGPGMYARFRMPFGITFNADGYLYVTTNQTVRRISLDGTVTTIAGSPADEYSSDGPREDAGIPGARGIVFDSQGNAFVAQQSAIRKITPQGVVSTFAGNVTQSGWADGIGPAARLSTAAYIAIDANDNLFIAEGSAVIRKITPAAEVITIAGAYAQHGDTDGNGTAARFQRPAGIAVDSSGNVYVSDEERHVIRKITPSGDVSTFAGTPGIRDLVDGTGVDARFAQPAGLAIDASGALLVAEPGNHCVRKVSLPGGVVTLWAGNQPEAPVHADMDLPMSVGVATDGVVFVGTWHTLMRIANGIASRIAGTDILGNVSGTGPIALLHNVVGLTYHEGTLFAVDDIAIRTVRPAGLSDRATALPASPVVNTTVQLTTDANNATSWEWRIVRRPASSNAELSATSIRTPVFTPDVADLYTVLLRAEGPAGVRYSTIDVQPSGCMPLAWATATIRGAVEEAACLESEGGTATVATSGGGTLTYQWGWRDAENHTITPIAGATLSSYRIRGADFGGTTGMKYLVVTVTPSCGDPIVSTPIVVTVSNQAQTPPVISVSSTTLLAGVEYTATASYANPDATIDWFVENATIVAGASTRTITFKPGATGDVALTAIVQNDCARTQSILPITPRAQGGTLLYLVTPCRLVDSRNTGGPLQPGEARNVEIGGHCNVPVDAKAVAMNVVAVSPTATGFLSVYPSDIAWPGTSLLNYRATRTRATAGIVPLAANGSVRVLNNGAPQHFIIDVTGYFK